MTSTFLDQLSNWFSDLPQNPLKISLLCSCAFSFIFFLLFLIYLVKYRRLRRSNNKNFTTNSKDLKRKISDDEIQLSLINNNDVDRNNNNDNPKLLYNELNEVKHHHNIINSKNITTRQSIGSQVSKLYKSSNYQVRSETPKLVQTPSNSHILEENSTKKLNLIFAIYISKQADSPIAHIHSPHYSHDFAHHYFDCGSDSDSYL